MFKQICDSMFCAQDSFFLLRKLEGFPEQIPETLFDDDNDLVFPATTTRLFFHLT